MAGSCPEPSQSTWLPGLPPVHALLIDRRALAHLDDVHDRVGLQQVLAAAHRAAGDIRNDTDDGLDLAGRLERCAAQRVAPAADVVGLLFAAHRLGGDGLGRQGGRGQVLLQTIALDVGAPGVGDHFHGGAVVAADETVQPFDQGSCPA